MYNVTKRKPDKRLNWIFKNINGASNILAPSIIQKSNFIKVGSTGTGEIKEVIPIIRQTDVGGRPLPVGAAES